MSGSEVDGVIVLTAAEALPDALAARAAEAAGGGATPRRLGATAAEFDAAPPGRDLAREALSGAPVDVNWVAKADRRKRLLIADMDSTIITVECVDELADFAGVKDRVAAITERAMRGELDFDAALTERVGLLAGLSESVLQQCFDERVRLTPGAEVLVRTMGRDGAATALVSGGFTFFTERVAALAGFARHQANRLLFEDGRLTGAVARPIVGREAKLQALQSIAAEQGLRPTQTLAVGDGANDLAMVEAAGLGAAYHAKPALAAAADVVIEHADLTALLYLQGYVSTEFATP